ncbi:spermatogenesis-associated protein 31D1 [Ctenodactylus gundi]
MPSFPHTGPGWIFVLPVSCSPQSQPLDITHFRQLLCPDPLCEVCNGATAEVSHLLSLAASLEYTATSSTPSASTDSAMDSLSLFSETSANPLGDLMPASGPVPSASTPSILSPIQVTSLENARSSHPEGETLLPEAGPPLDTKSPVDHPLSTEAHRFPFLLPAHVLKAESVLKRKDTLSLAESTRVLPTYAQSIRCFDCSDSAFSRFSWWQNHKNISLPRLSPFGFNQENVSLHPLASSLSKDCDTSHKEASHISSLNPNIQELLERQINKKMSLLNLEKKNEQLSKEKWAEDQSTLSWSPLQSLPGEKGLINPQRGWDIKGKPKHLESCQQLICVNTLSVNAQQKYSQLFWGLPSLHSESIVAPPLVSRSSSSLGPQLLLFNGICTASEVQIQDQESPPPPQSHLFPLTRVHSQPCPPTKHQSPNLPEVHSQPHVQSLLSSLPLSSPQQNENYINTFHIPQNADYHIFNGNQHLEQHMLKQYQESLLGLIPQHHKCQEVLGSLATNIPSVRQSSHAYVPVSICPGHFHISRAQQENLELHVSNRQTPCCNLQICSHIGYSVPTEPWGSSAEISQHNCRHTYPQSSELQGHSCMDLEKREFSTPGCSHESLPTMFQPRSELVKNVVGNILEKSSINNPLMISEYCLKNDLNTLPEEKCACERSSRTDLRNQSTCTANKNLDLKEMKSILRLHVSQKCWQISAGRIPLGVCHSWLCEDNTSSPFGSSQTNMESRNMAPLPNRIPCQNSNLNPSFLDHKTQKVLEAHIVRFRVSEKWGLPLKVLESIKVYVLREDKTWPLPQCGTLSSSTLLSRLDSKDGVSRCLIETSKSFHDKKMEAKVSLSSIHDPLCAPSSVTQEGQGTPRQSCSDTDHEMTENVQKIKDGRQTLLPHAHCITNQVSQSDSVRVSGCSQEWPSSHEESGLESMNEKMSSCHRVKMFQGKRLEGKNLEHVSRSSMCTEISKAHDLCGLQSQLSDILATRMLGSCQMTNVTANEVEASLTPENAPPRTSIPKDPLLSDFKSLLLSEPKFQLRRGFCCQTDSSLSDISLTSDTLTSDSSFTFSHDESSESLEAFQELHAHWDDMENCRGQWKKPWVPKHALCMCQLKSLQPAEGESTPRCERERCTRRDTQIETSRTTKKKHPVKNRKLEEACNFQPQRKQFPFEKFFRLKMRRFFQWIDFRRKGIGQESPEKERALFLSCGPPEAHKLMAALGRILEEKMACMQQPEVLELSEQKEDRQLQAEPNRGQPSNYGAVSDSHQGKGSYPISCNQEAAPPGLSGLRV